MMVRQHLHDRRQAFTLIEILAVLMLLPALMGLAGATLLGVIKTSQATMRTLHEVAGQQTMADAFRRDVARSLAVPEQFASFRADKSCLILQQSSREHVVYCWDGKRLQRAEIEGAQTRTVPLPEFDGRIEFERGGPGEKLVTMRLVREVLHGPSPTLEILAALGGERR